MKKVAQNLGLLLIFSIVFISFGNSKEETEPVLKHLSFDEKTGTVSYELTYPALIRIRLGIKDGPLYTTLVDWEKRSQGKHKESWDGWDASRQINLLGQEDLAFTFNYFTEDERDTYGVKMEELMPSPEALAIGKAMPTFRINQMHKKHKREVCFDPEAEIILPKGVSKTKEGIFIINKPTPITIDIPTKDRSLLTAERYNLHIFIDNIFIQGELQGYSPYTFLFDPKKINKGRHILTVNLSGFNDHIATTSQMIWIE